MFEIVHNRKVLKIEYIQGILWSVHTENTSGWPENVCGQQTYFVWIVGLFFKNVFLLFDPTFKNKKTSYKNQDFQLFWKNTKIWQFRTIATSPDAWPATTLCHPGIH